MNSLSVAFLLMILSVYSVAEDFVLVDDMSKLDWQMRSSTGEVFLRNLHEFGDNTFLTCCYNYWIDTTTSEGKAVWSVILAHMISAKPLYLGVANKEHRGPITYFGRW